MTSTVTIEKLQTLIERADYLAERYRLGQHVVPGGTISVLKSISATLLALEAENVKLRELVRLYVDPCDVRPEHEALVTLTTLSEEG